MRRVYEKLAGQVLPKLLQREHKAMMARLVELTRARHAKYGDTLFHLEPNIKDCPGGLRDVHVCGWMTKLLSRCGAGAEEAAAERAGLIAARTTRSFARRWSFCAWCGVFCTTGMSGTTIRWTGRRRMRLRRRWLGLTGRQAEEGGCGVLDAALFSSCAERGAAREADDG